MLKYLGKKFDKQMVREGVYITEYDFNFDHELRFKGVELINPDSFEPLVDKGDRYVEYYGVCDNHQQILDYAPEIVSSNKKYVIGLTLVKKSEQPDWGGWRWHKWGEYIGVHEPQCEFIYDEPVVKQVYCYHIYEIK